MRHVDLVVTRSAGVVEWLRRQGICAPVIPHANRAVVRGRVVVGNLPLALAQHCAAVLVIEFAGEPPRYMDPSADDMESACAELVEYVVSGPLDACGADSDSWRKLTEWRDIREQNHGWEREWVRYSTAQDDHTWLDRHLGKLAAAKSLYDDAPYDDVQIAVRPAISLPPRDPSQPTRIVASDDIQTSAEWPPPPRLPAGSQP